MKNFKDYLIKESEKDGKNGHYEDFVDEDTGEIVTLWVDDPTPEELEVSDLDLTVAGTMNAINMVESGAKEVSEDDMLEALMFGHEAIKELCAFQEEIIAEIGKPDMEYETLEITDDFKEEIKELAEDKMN